MGWVVRIKVLFLLLSDASLPSQAKHASGEHSFGVDGDTGKIRDMKGYLYESAAVKVQMLKTAIEVSANAFAVLFSRAIFFADTVDNQSACLLLRVDDIVSAKRKGAAGGGGGGGPQLEDMGGEMPEQ
jgi:T-complex protein 1 subunit gamma